MDSFPCNLSLPPELPIAAMEGELFTAIQTHQALVVTGETGSGKTTQLPKLLLRTIGDGNLIVSEPRRLAAIAAAERLRVETGASEPLIAHSVRFDNRSRDTTRIRVATDGLILAEAARDPLFRRYRAFMLDEAHERSLNIDLLLGLLVRALVRRPDLKLVITSATMDAQQVASWLSSHLKKQVPIFHVAGRCYPVEIQHQDAEDQDLGYLSAAVRAIRTAHEEPGSGGILCFLPTERDILEARRKLSELPGATIQPLFSRLNPSEQRRIFQPVRGRRIVLSTNVAETSLTVPGIVTVIDTGLARIKYFHLSSRTERLPIEAVSRAALAQRAGRAGRVEPGVCIRLFTAQDEVTRDTATKPEILRSNLAGILLTLGTLHLGKAEDFPWLDAPLPRAWDEARVQLAELGAWDPERDQPTALGRRLGRLPVDPQVARILLEGVTLGVAHEAATIAALLSIQDPRQRPLGEEAKADAAQARFQTPLSDLAGVLMLWNEYSAQPSNSTRDRFCRAHFLSQRRMREWSDVRHQLWQFLIGGLARQRLPSQPHQEVPLASLHKAVLSGMLGNVLLWDEAAGHYRAGGGREVHIHPGSGLAKAKVKRPIWLVACEILQTSRTFARVVLPIEPAWVIDYAGSRLKRTLAEPVLDPVQGRVIAEQTLSWKGLELERRRLDYRRINPEHAAEVFLTQALVEGRLEGTWPWLLAQERLRERIKGLAAPLRDRTLDPPPETWRKAWQTKLAALAVQTQPHPKNLRLALSCEPAKHEKTQRTQRAQRTTENLSCQSSGDGTSKTPPWPSVSSVSFTSPVSPSHEPICDVRTLIAQARAKRVDLALSLSDLLPPETCRRASLFPAKIRLSNLHLNVTYRHDPGADDDGATLHVTDDILPRLSLPLIERAVPGLLEDTCRVAIDQLPRAQRSEFLTNLPDFCQNVQESPLPLEHAISQFLPEDARFDVGKLPPWTKLRIRLTGADGQLLYAGRDLWTLAGRTKAGDGDDPLLALKAAWDTPVSMVFPGEIPLSADLGDLKGHPALVRARGPDALLAARRTVFLGPHAARWWHADGVRALVERHLESLLSNLAKRPGPTVGTLSRPALCRGLSLAYALDGEDLGSIRSRETFDALLTRVSKRLTGFERTLDTWTQSVSIDLGRIDGFRRKTSGFGAAGVLDAIAQDAKRLFAPGFWDQLPWNLIALLPEWTAAWRRAAEKPTTKSLDRSARERLETNFDRIAIYPPGLVALAGHGADLTEARSLFEQGMARTLGVPVPFPGEGWLSKRIDGMLKNCAALDLADRITAREAKERLTFLIHDPSPWGQARARRLKELLERFPSYGLQADPDAERLRIKRLMVNPRG